MTRKNTYIILLSFGLGIAIFLFGHYAQLLQHDLWHCPAPFSAWEFEQVDDFKDGLARVAIKVQGEYRYGFVNREGQIAIPLQYAELRPFAEGLAAAEDAQSRKWGFLDRDNRTVIPFVYDYVTRDFRDGVAIVKQNKAEWLINTRGEAVSERYKFLFAHPKHGFIHARRHDGQSHFLDLRGQPLQGEALARAQRVIDAQDAESARLAAMSHAERRAENFALMHRVLAESGKDYPLQTAYRQGVALKQEKKGADWYLIDENGQRLAGPYVSTSIVEENGEYYPFAADLPRIIVYQRGKEYWRAGLIDAQGNEIVPFGRYSKIGAFREGYAVVEETTSTVSRRMPETTFKSHGFIDSDGREVIAPRYRHAHPFSQGWAAVQYRNHWRFIDRQGCAMRKPAAP